MELKVINGGATLKVSDETFGKEFNQSLVHQVVTAYRNGGRAFAAKPRSFEQKVNKKMYRGALQSMLSELVRQDRLVVTDTFTVDAPKTKLVADKLRSLKLEHVLIIVEGVDEKLFLAARNLMHVEVLPVSHLNPLSLASYDKVLITSGAVKLIEERLQ